MKLKRNLFIIFSVGLLALASTVLDVFNYNPYNSNISVFVNFYISCFFAISSVLALIIYFIKVKIKAVKNNITALSHSFRQACFISLAITSLLILKGLGLLDWWVGGPLVASIILLELFFQTSSSKARNQKKINKGEL